jgi:tRNA G10  N-methylase Trm11
MGTDIDNQSIEKSLLNLNSIKDVLPQTYKDYNKIIQINFQTLSIDQLQAKLPFKNHERLIVAIITQPPYGLTINKSVSEIEEIYSNLTRLVLSLSKQHKVFLSMIFNNQSFMIDILNEMKEQFVVNQMDIKEIKKIKKHNNEFGILFTF